MKLITLIVSLLAFSTTSMAQANLQEMYDFKREHPTTTLEMFKDDKWGSSFFFVDIYHPSGNNYLPGEFYTEISRAINFWQGSKLGVLSAHAEWNGGQYSANAWLFGAEYFIHNAEFSQTLTLQVLYKNIRGGSSNVPVQFTAVWNVDDIFNVKGLSFSGFADFWWEDVVWNQDDETSTVFMTEPQIWYNLGRHFSCENLHIGGEIEICSNFAGGIDFKKGWQFNPCLGIKWTF